MELTKQQKSDLRNKSGIYIIINKITDKTYIGSSYNLIQRLSSHLSGLRKNKHSNVILQRNYNIYGESSFEFEVLEFCEKELLQAREQYFINQFKPEINIAKDTKAPMRGRKHSEETIKKLSGKIPWNLGIERTEEERNYISQRKKEEWSKKSDEYKKRRSDIGKINPSKYWLGKKLPEHMLESVRKNAKEKRQRIICNETMEIFESQFSAANKLNVRQGHINENLKGIRLRVDKKYTFKRLENES